ncbi:hypothetical protein RND81_03G089200 [Saponaria officinalis]|uniref:Zinc finger BED domain-containing protein RICESLEEPER 2-like n=1 Tax=Saponaria officinalis TaxID=3572 RepID=A0AAW1M4Y9_SAPOF
MPANVDIKQKLLNFETTTIVNEEGSIENVRVPTLWAYDYDRTRKSLARMIIVDELPFLTVEKIGFRGFCKDMNPQFIGPSRFTVAKDCYSLFIEEKRKLHDFFGTMSSRVCLTTDLWTSGQNLSYMCLTAHFINRGWNLHKRVINFCQVYGHTGKIIGQTVEKCLSEWNLTKVLTVTVDNASSNDVAVDYLKRKFNNSESDLMQGKYLHMRCVAHILNLVVKYGLNELSKAVSKIRALCKYVRSSPARKKKFEACVLEEKIKSKSSVCLDVETRWNSTYMMLESCLKFKKAFGLLFLKDSTLQNEMSKHGDDVTTEEWKQVSSLLPFLKVFYDATLKMSGSLYVTSNSYVEVIFGVGEVL